MVQRSALISFAIAVGALLTGCGSSDTTIAATSSTASSVSSATSVTSATSAASGVAGVTTTTTGTTTTTATTTSLGTRVTVNVVKGVPQGGVQRAKIAKGTPVTIEITADADNEVHIHGYDLQQEVGPAKLAKFSFSADLAGVFEVELHDGKRKILELEVK